MNASTEGRKVKLDVEQAEDGVVIVTADGAPLLTITDGEALLFADLLTIVVHGRGGRKTVRS